MKKNLKWLSLFMILILMVSTLAACGGGSDTGSAASSDGASSESEAEAPEAEAPEAEPGAEETAPAEEIEGTLLETEFYRVIYSDDWSYDEENTSITEGSYADATLVIPESDDANVVSVEFEVQVTDPNSYRDKIKDAGFDAYDLVENDTGEYTNIGGIDCLSYTGKSWGSDCKFYFARIENAGATAIIRIIGDLEDERVDTLLQGVTFTVEDTGHIDPPWPWNGTPYTTDPAEVMAGTTTITSEQLVLDDSLIVDDIFSGRIAVSGDDVYVLLDNTLYLYNYTDGKLTYNKTIELDSDYEEITACADGIVYLDDFGSDLIGLKDGEKVCSYDGTDYSIMHPSGEWGISFFTSNTLKKFTLNDGVISFEDFTVPEVDLVSHVSISENHIFVSGKSTENEHQAIFVCDLDGNLEMTLGDKEFGEPDSLGSVTQVLETGNGFLALDGNMRDVLIWKPTGEYIASMEDSDLFGTTYPWMSAAGYLSDGSLIVGMTEEREDESADEFIIFRLSGF